MLTKGKLNALCMFAHSRLSGKCGDTTTTTSENMLQNNSDAELVSQEIIKLVNLLEAKHLTVGKLNQLPDSLTAKQITYYYQTSLNTMDKYIKKGDEIVEAIIGLGIITYLEDEKELETSNVDAVALIQKFEAASVDRKLNSLMLKIGAEIVDAVSKANYALWCKDQRRNTTMKKNRKKRRRS